MKIKLLFLLITLISLFGCSKHFKESRPNIIFLLADDHRWDALGCMGNPIIQTPNIDQIAVKGIIFENAYVTTSICAASRASILAGKYASKTGIHDFSTEFSSAALAETYPFKLKNAGYFTGFIGKFGVGNQPPDSIFDYWNAMTGQPRYENYDEQGNMKHFTRIVAENIMEFLSRCSSDQPFCLSVSFKAPHVQDGDPRQFIYDTIYSELYKDDEIPLPATAGDEYYNIFPDEFKNNNEARIRWQLRFPDSVKHKESVRGYYRLVTGIDVVVGELLEELEKLGFHENTIIMYSGDNGFYLGEHGMAGKWYGHEESIRVPLIIYDPGLKDHHSGTRVKEIALNIDIAPTILGFCNEDIPESMQGINLMDIIEGKKSTTRKDFLYEHLIDIPRENAYIPRSEGVVSLDYKYLRYIDFDPVFEEIYDLKSDPLEVVNLASDPQYQRLVDSMRNRYNELKEMYQ